MLSIVLHLSFMVVCFIPQVLCVAVDSQCKQVAAGSEEGQLGPGKLSVFMDYILYS